MCEEKKYYRFNDLAWILLTNGLAHKNGLSVESGLISWMHDNGWLIDTPERANQPSEEAFSNGLFAVRSTSYIEDDGSNTTEYETLLTEKGEDYFENLFLGA
jgi:phage antirepressor YoqD-like protein